MYEIKNCGLEFIEFVRILVEGIVIGIVKILDGFFMVNDLLKLFCWDDFFIKLNLLYLLIFIIFWFIYLVWVY